MTLDTVDCGGDWLSWRKRPLKVNYNNNNAMDGIEETYTKPDNAFIKG